MASLHGAGQGLQSDVVGAAVAAEGDELVGVVDFTLALQYAVSGFHAAAGSCGIFKGGVDVAVLPSGIRIHERRNFQTSCSVGDHGFVFGVQGAEHGAHGNAAAAAGTQTVAGGEALRLTQFLFEIIRHEDRLLSVPNGDRRAGRCPFSGLRAGRRTRFRSRSRQSLGRQAHKQN